MPKWNSTTQIFLESIVYTVRNISRLVEMNISLMCAYIISCAGILYINKVWIRYAVAHPDEYDPLLFTAAGAMLVLLNWLLFVWMFVRVARFRIIGNCVDETLHGKELQNVWKMFAAVLPVAIFILIVSGDGAPYAQAFFQIVILILLVGGAFAIGAIFYSVLRLLIAAPAWTIGLRLHGPGEIWRFAGARAGIAMVCLFPFLMIVFFVSRLINNYFRWFLDLILFPIVRLNINIFNMGKMKIYLGGSLANVFDMFSFWCVVVFVSALFVDIARSRDDPDWARKLQGHTSQS